MRTILRNDMKMTLMFSVNMHNRIRVDSEQDMLEMTWFIS